MAAHAGVAAPYHGHVRYLGLLGAPGSRHRRKGLVTAGLVAGLVAPFVLANCGELPRGGRPALVRPPAPPPEPAGPPNVYAATTSPAVPAAAAGLAPRVYVPNTLAGTVTVIDPATFEVVAVHRVGRVPHHVTPAWGLTQLFVNNTEGDSLTSIDPATGGPTATVPVPDPYNLYFTPDGSKAIVVAERLQRLDFRDPQSWELIKSVPVPWSGVDHGDFSADSRYFIASTEFSGHVVKVDVEQMEVSAVLEVGGAPIDVKLSPDGSVFFVTNQLRHGVSVIDPVAMREVGFIPTGRGAHGLNFSRDTSALYVSNRLEGTISVLDVATRQVAGKWAVGGSPDMMQVTPDGRQLWVSNRFHGTISVIDTASGNVIKTIRTGAGAHGLTLFPQPGRYSVGHNGVYR